MDADRSTAPKMEAGTVRHNKVLWAKISSAIVVCDDNANAVALAVDITDKGPRLKFLQLILRSD